MFLLVLGVLLLVVALVGVVVGLRTPRFRVAGLATGALGVLLAILAISSQTCYSQDTGEAPVLVDVSGTIAGQETAPGFHGKAPWQSVKTFNIRIQTLSFVGTGDTDSFSAATAACPA